MHSIPLCLLLLFSVFDTGEVFSFQPGFRGPIREVRRRSCPQRCLDLKIVGASFKVVLRRPRVCAVACSAATDSVQTSPEGDLSSVPLPCEDENEDENKKLQGSTASLITTERLRNWRGEHTVTAMPHTVVAAQGVHLSRYCGDGTVFPTLGSRTQAKLAAHRGQLLLNDAETRGHTRVHSGDVLTLHTPLPPPMAPYEELRVERLFLELTEAKPEGVRLEVLFEDDEFAVVLKPPGIHSTSWAGTQRREHGRSELCLSDVLPLLLTPPPAGSGALPSPLAAHRLDARVAGVIAVAKTRRALAGLSSLFATRAVSKVYRAIVAGEVKPEQLIETGAAAGSGVRFEAADTPGGVRIEQVLECGKLATTELAVLSVTPCGVYGSLSTLELRPLSGRRHQLRLACAQCCGAPIIGDDLYHADADAVRSAAGLAALPPVRRKAGLFLQSLELELPHPVSGERVRVCAPEMPRFSKLRDRAASGAAWTDAEWEAWRAPSDDDTL